MKITPTLLTALVNPFFGHLALLLAVCSLLVPADARANPFLPKAGEAATTVRVATCAVSGGFVHLYTAMDNGLFEKYAIRVDHKFISGSAMNLTALAGDEISFLYCAADGTIPGLATGIDGKLIASPLIGLPYVLLAQKDVKRLEDLIRRATIEERISQGALGSGAALKPD